VFEHFHADHAVVLVAMRLAVERANRFEADVGEMREPGAAIVHLKLVELRADG
jgi:hypothetical protein